MITSLREHPHRLTKIVGQQGQLYEAPCNSDVWPAAMSKVRVHGLRAGGRQEYGTKKPEAMRVPNQEIHGITRMDRFQDSGVCGDLRYAQYDQHRKPHNHDGSEGSPNPLRTESLKEKQ